MSEPPVPAARLHAAEPSPAPEVAAAYDSIAGDYDRLVSEDRWMRNVLWDHYRVLFGSGDRLLELACGTGLDTAFLASLGARVTAVDASAGMVDRLRQRVRGDAPIQSRITTRVGDIGGEFRAFLEPDEGDFDGIVSAFAGLNTVSDLSFLARQAANVLRPGGRFVAHFLGPVGVWERLGLIVRGRFRRAAELSRRRHRVAKIRGWELGHRVLTPAEAARAFEPHFRLCRRYALGFLWPQSTGRHLPLTLATALGHLESRAGRLPPFSGWGRFFVLDLERVEGRPEP